MLCFFKRHPTQNYTDIQCPKKTEVGSFKEVDREGENKKKKNREWQENLTIDSKMKMLKRWVRVDFMPTLVHSPLIYTKRSAF